MRKDEYKDEEDEKEEKEEKEEDRKIVKRNRNKAGYTATLVACGRAGAVLEKVTRASGQEPYAQKRKNETYLNNALFKCMGMCLCYLFSVCYFFRIFFGKSDAFLR